MIFGVKYKKSRISEHVDNAYMLYRCAYYNLDYIFDKCKQLAIIGVKSKDKNTISYMLNK